ncbi:MAG TPA: D-alanyl-D-alanine carboxypeptidase/D-alanyl-D-alanine-endopeptidase [Bacteroidales bacterium]|nr:D-alanyl-D-alanine carboxypeptidase/D-alanyl-D-alanine-endopeptidase [Bacteroidales bacterium]
MNRITLLGIGLLVNVALMAQADPVQKILANECTKNANVSICVQNLSTGKTLTTCRSQAVVPPASVMKVITSATALEVLGEDFRFSTFLETDGAIENGVLKGNLYIRGTGDPTLGSMKVGNRSFLYKWVQALKTLGIREIQGDVISDASFFDGDAINPQWIWEDIGNYYAPGIYALPYMDNTLNVQLRSAAVGSVAEVVKTIPYIEGLAFENHIRCTSITYDGAYIHGVPYSNVRYLVGSVPSNRGIFGVRGDIPNPPLLLAQHFCMRLREAGIMVRGHADYQTETSVSLRTAIYTHFSEPLLDIIKEVNQQSNNLYAEQVFRYLGSLISTPCTIANSVEVERNCWRNRGIFLNSSFIMDGCGLAPQDALSSETLVQVLSYMWRGNHRQAFLESLPVAGKSGTLKSFLCGTPLEGKVLAKSGTTSRIKSYAGYIYLPNNQTLAFAVIVNNANCKPKVVQHIIESFLIDVYQANR